MHTIQQEHVAEWVEHSLSLHENLEANFQI